MLKLFTLIIILLNISCSTDEHPSYETLSNNITNENLTISFDSDKGLTNIAEIMKSLPDEQKIVFTQSLSWYGTESEFSLEKLHDKNAKELVDIVNCLKEKTNNQTECFNNK